MNIIIVDSLPTSYMEKKLDASMSTDPGIISILQSSAKFEQRFIILYKIYIL